MAKIGLKEAIQAAYLELREAITEIPTHDDLNFQYEMIELELAVEMGEASETQGGVKFWVLEGGAKRARDKKSTHVVRVTVTPRDRDGGLVTIASAS
ncbi:trypco2 family protein [Streptomyces sp. NPDC057438]|uniref:trypco2 family protein n=1 Tax=Streptomyces sp. NPDC057438 TaxID=3346133 RepID=UPI0036B04A63